MVQKTILVRMTLFRIGFEPLQDQNGPKWSILVQFGLKRSILVHLGPPTVPWPFLKNEGCHGCEEDRCQPAAYHALSEGGLLQWILHRGKGTWNNRTLNLERERETLTLERERDPVWR